MRCRPCLAFQIFLSKMYSFTILSNKEILSVTIARAEDGKYSVTALPTGSAHSRVMHDSTVRIGVPLEFSTEGTVTITWGVVGSSGFYDNRRIELDITGGVFKYSIWGTAPAPKLHDYNHLFTHSFASNPAPVYKVYKSKGETLAKLV